MSNDDPGGSCTRTQIRRFLEFWPTNIALLSLFFAPPTFAMDFSWGRGPFEPASGHERNSTLYMTGEIRSGDYARFKQFLLKDLTKYFKSPRQIVLASSGGDLLETLKIADLLKEMLGSVYVLEAKCASSCFFLYLSGAHRFAMPGLVGVHRPYFNQRYFAGLSPSQAQKRQADLMQAVNKILREAGLPQYMIDTMNQTSSSEMYWLPFEDLEKVGARPAWYEELMIAKCGFDKRLEEAFKSTPSNASQYKSLRAA